MKYLITVSYDGSKFFGFQRLNNQPTVQKELETALSVINKKSVVIKGAGRTDRGVHALSQKCHFNLDVNIDSKRLKNALNNKTSKYISIKDCQIVSDNFHARFNVKEKTYLYKINLDEYNPLLEDYVLQINYKLNIKKMKKAARYFIGIHNFKLFVSGSRENYDAIIYKIKFKKEKNILNIYFSGKSFYRYMVRNLVGALLEVGKGKIPPIKIKELLQGKTENHSLPTAKANGLYLFSIKY